jgi:putative membrane protein
MSDSGAGLGQKMRKRRAPLRSVGVDPDYRFTLANERTFLAWLRTGLALAAGAVALAGLLPDLRPREVRVAITGVLLLLAMVVTVGAYLRWEGAERALREGRSLPVGLLPRLVVSGLVVAMIGIGVLVLVGTGAR